LYGATTGGSDKYYKYKIYTEYHFISHSATCKISHKSTILDFLYIQINSVSPREICHNKSMPADDKYKEGKLRRRQNEYLPFS